MQQNSSRRRAASVRRLQSLFVAASALAVVTVPAARLAAQAAPPAESADAAPPITLDTVVVTATRTPVALDKLASTAEVVSAADLNLRQQTTLLSALSTVPGMPTATSGQTGAATSLFIRGSESDHVLVLVDGIRFSDANTSYFNLLGGVTLGAHERVEIVRGPQSPLHGGEALGGVVSINQIRGCGPTSGSVLVEAGSFGTVQAGVSTQGSSGANSFSFSAAGGHTDNDRADNAFDRGNFALRLDRDVSNTVRVGTTLRGYHGLYESPDSRFVNDPNNTERERILLSTVFVEVEPSDEWFLRATLGGQFREQRSSNPPPNPNPSTVPGVTTIENRRAIFDAQATWTGIHAHRITFGTTLERTATTNDGFGDIDETQNLVAFFVQDEITVRENLFLTLGVRKDDHDTFGNATTGRAMLAWIAVPDTLKLRGSYGTAFRSPSFLDLYGTASFYAGNPDLQPEEARGWDAGFDYTLPARRGLLSFTFFRTSYENLINFDFSSFPGTVVNVGNARTYGTETSLRLNITETTRLHLAHTWLEAEDLSGNRRLLRRPRHQVGADLNHDLSSRLTVGAGLTWVVDREDVHAQTFARIDAEDYLVARLYGRYALRENLGLRLRVENAFDERYESVHGFPAPGVGVYGGIDWSF